MISILRKPIGLLKEPSILDQTKWPVGFYSFPNQPRNVEFFNCGIIKFANITWLVARKRITNIGRVGHNRISFWNLSNNRPVAEKEVHFYKTWMDEHHEDPRVIAHGKTLLMSYCNFRPYSKAHQCMAEVHKDFRVKRPIHIRFGKNGPTVMSNTGHEKNWIWFFHDDQLFFIYKTDPHTVCRYGGQGKVVQVFENTKACPDWKYGEIRGGTPPIRIGDEYFAFFHSSVDWKHPKRRYYMGAYAFKAEPPFRITRYTVHPLLYGSEADPRNMGAPIVVFPCGSLFENGEWLVTMGVNDCRCAWIKIPHGDLLERMVKV